MIGAAATDAREEPVVFSVVVPTRGRPGYLAGCLAALERVQYPSESLEVVVVNDGGGSATEAVVAQCGKNLDVRLAVPTGTGPSAARNAGAGAARGRYVAYTDDDCEPEPGWLAELERALAANPGAAVGGRTLNGAPGNRAAVATQVVVDALQAHCNEDSTAPRFFSSSNLAFPAQPLREVGGFNEAFRYAEDREMCARWLRSGHRFAAAPDAVVIHMRTLTLRQFVGQHYGYGRGAWAFHGYAQSNGGGRERPGIGRALVRQTARSDRRGRLSTAAYVALSQAATAAGFAREATATRLGRNAGGKSG